MVYRNISKEYVVERLKSVAKLGWIKNHNSNNAGGVGNTIASMLGLPSDNLPIADTAQWELKSHKIGSSSLVTLLHLEPEPRESRVVAKLLLPKYGWPDQSRPNEISFRQTIQAQHPSDRGFKVSIDTQNEKVSIVFDSAAVDQRHSNWLEQVNSKAGLGPINPQPYWNFQQLFLKAWIYPLHLAL